MRRRANARDRIPGRLRAWRLVLAFCCVALLAERARAAGGAAPVADPCDLQRVLQLPALRAARVGALVERVSDASVLFAHDPDRPLAPASNQKVLTGLAALSMLGPGHRFETAILAPAPDREGRVPSLTLEAGGDPALTGEDYARLAAELRRVGVRRADRVWFDDGAFDRERWHPAWGPIGARAYEAPIGALMANYGAYTVTLRPGAAPGDPVRATIEPPVASLRLLVRATTTPARSPTTLRIERERNAREELLIVSGTLAVDAGEQTLRRSVDDPSRYAADVFVAALGAAGIELGAPPVLGHAPGQTPRLVRFEGPTLGETVQRMLKYSSNPIAEGLLKAMGARASGTTGSFSAGVAALREALDARGLDTHAAIFVDGSGLAASNRLTARLLVATLRSAHDDFSLGPELLAALPVAGRDGTLRTRAPGARERVRAKTGTLTGVSSLSGFARSADDEELVFSWIVNGGDADVVSATDAFAEALAECRSRSRSAGAQRLRGLPLPRTSQSSESPSFSASMIRKSLWGVVPDS